MMDNPPGSGYGAVRRVEPLETSVDRPRRMDRSFKRAVVGGTVVGFLLLAVLAVAGRSAASDTSMDLGAADSGAAAQATATAAASESLTWKAVNKYTAVNGALGGNYPWVQSTLLEPHRASTFSVTNPSAQHRYSWDFHGVENAPGFSLQATGVDASVTFDSIGTYSFTVTEMLDGAATRTETDTVIVRYVRRELRSLDDEDRDRFFDAAEQVWSLSSAEGVDKYGANFKAISDMVSIHNDLAGDHDCDHMHDGMGFLTQHAGLTYLFERALQAVDSSVSMPYWDWTVDVAKDYAKGLNNSALRQWDVFGPAYFGSADPLEHTVTEGRFAYSAVSGNNWDGTHNPYGIMRAPWNMNSRPYVTRYANLGSLKHAYAAADMGMPTCMDLWNMLMNDDTWFDFAWALPYDPHARVHSVIGGSEAGPDFDVLADFFDDDMIAMIAKLHFYWTKNMWRNDKLTFPDFCSLDTPQHECKGQCPGMPAALKSGHGGSYIDTFGDQDVIQAMNALAVEDQITVIRAMCTSSLSIGEQMESASPSDISFWPIHPNLERIWSVKKLSGTFQSEDWPTTGNSLATGGATCWGHAADDVLPYGDIYGYPSSKLANLTNQDLYNVMNPIEANAPYIYDDLTFSHCKIYDMDFSTWIPSVDEETPEAQLAPSP